jgi:hypothetical protein
VLTAGFYLIRMKTEIKEVYKCDYCNKLYQMKHHCLNHELSCKKRPDYLRPCHNCQVLKKVKETIWAGYGDEYGNECERDVDVLFCEKRDCFIYPPSVAAKGNAFEMAKLNIEMPKECEFFLACS